MLGAKSLAQVTLGAHSLVDLGWPLGCAPCGGSRVAVGVCNLPVVDLGVGVGVCTLSVVDLG